MECRKCRGLMVEEWCADALEEAFLWKCLHCGAMEDATILHNQGFPFPVRCRGLGVADLS